MTRNYLFENLSVPKHLKKQNQSHQSFTSKKLVCCFLTACAVTLGLNLSTSVQLASAQASRCPSNRICLFEDINYRGSYFQFRVGSPNFTNLTCSGCRNGNFNDEASSFVNNTPDTWCLWESANYRGRNLVQVPNDDEPNAVGIPPYSTVNWIGAVSRYGNDANDRASSLRRANYSSGSPQCLTP